MKKALALVLAVAMVVSLGACFAVNTSATALAKRTVLEIEKTNTAPDVTDGEVDSSYTKISEYECWRQTGDTETGDLVWVRNEYASVNGLLPTGRDTLGADGKMVIKSDLVKDADGEIRYYENNVPVAKGLVKDADGSYYFINSAKKAVKDCEYAFSAVKANGYLQAGRYNFGIDGKIIMD